jgi:hypothetical protein
MWHGTGEGEGLTGRPGWCWAAVEEVGRAQGNSVVFNLLEYLQKTRIDSIQRCASQIQKISNKICVCRVLNKKQLSLLKPFKIRDRI